MSFVGIDVSKLYLDLAVRPEGESRRYSNNEAGIAELVERVKAIAPELVVMEATGGFERVVATHLAAADVPLAVVNPKQTRDFAKAIGKLAKTDAIDAEGEAQFGKAGRPINLLPDKALQQSRVVGQVIEDLRRGQTVAFEHQVELAHDLLPQFKRQTEETHRWVRGAERCTVPSVTPIRESIVGTSSRRRRDKQVRKNDERGLFLSDSVLAATVSLY